MEVMLFIHKQKKKNTTTETTKQRTSEPKTSPSRVSWERGNLGGRGGGGVAK